MARLSLHYSDEPEEKLRTANTDYRHGEEAAIKNVKNFTGPSGKIEDVPLIWEDF
jgi:hypothetical protein